MVVNLELLVSVMNLVPTIMVVTMAHQLIVAHLKEKM